MSGCLKMCFFPFFPHLTHPLLTMTNLKKANFFLKTVILIISILQNDIYTLWFRYTIILYEGRHRIAPAFTINTDLRVKPWVIVIRVKQWLEKRLASIYILGLQSEAVYVHVITQFSWMGRNYHILSAMGLWSAGRGAPCIPFHSCVYMYLSKKKMKAKPIQKWIQQCK